VRSKLSTRYHAPLFRKIASGSNSSSRSNDNGGC